ncbi:MAG: HlyD family efflux transporter periplasmic adaptor subunit [Bacteroidaceae bacterium]|nr:HlyD family efflux transporter periplasmic adaptor subunit [Bacteroidaceae bacterium]
MDIKLPKKPWYVRYRMYLMGGAVLIVLIVYALVLQLGPRTLKVEIDDAQIAMAEEGEFLEYIDVNGVVCPATSMRVNAKEGGTVEQICCHNGDVLKRGDTILVLSNSKVLEEIAAERQSYELQQMQHRQQLIEMQQKSITLRSQALQADFELKKMEQDYELAKEEAQMGVRSQAQLKVAKDEYEYNRRRTLLNIESLHQDSVLNVINRQLIQQQMAMEAQKLGNSNRRREALVILAPTDGQISNLNAVIGGQVSAGEQVGEIGVLTDYKVTARLNEYYIDRIQSGLPATAMLKGRKLSFEVSRITPQVQEHSFAVELRGECANLRLGQSLHLQIELGAPEQRLIIPRGNFYAQTSGQWIMKVDEAGHQARRVPIKLGRQNAEHYEVVEGLHAGDHVLVSGYESFGDAEVVTW